MESLRKSCTSAPILCDVLGSNGIEATDVNMASLSASDVAGVYVMNCGQGQLSRQTTELAKWALPGQVKGNIYVGGLGSWVVCWVVG